MIFWRKIFLSNLISRCVNAGTLECVSSTILHNLKEGKGNYLDLDEATYYEVVKGFLKNGSFKALSFLINEAQKLEPSSDVVDKSVGYGIINACVNNGLTDKAHNILDEMNAQEGFLGLGVYLPILKA